MKVLLSLEQGNRTTSHHVNSDQCIIGRVDGDLIVEDQYCSRKHAVLYETADGKLKIRDFYSRNGLYVNGERTHWQTVSAGDVIQIGLTKITLKGI